MAKKAKASGGTGVLTGGGKAVRWALSILLILYSFITIFVVAITILNSFKGTSKNQSTSDAQPDFSSDGAEMAQAY